MHADFSNSLFNSPLRLYTKLKRWTWIRIWNPCVRRYEKTADNVAVTCVWFINTITPYHFNLLSHLTIFIVTTSISNSSHMFLMVTPEAYEHLLWVQLMSRGCGGPFNGSISFVILTLKDTRNTEKAREKTPNRLFVWAIYFYFSADEMTPICSYV